MALKEKGIAKLLDDAREDNKENDARLMSPKRELFDLPPAFRHIIRLMLLRVMIMTLEAGKESSM